MRKVLWILAGVGVLFWTTAWLGAFLVLGVFGDAARVAGGHVPGFPNETFSVPWAVELFRGLGSLSILFVWGMGTAMILAVPVTASVIGRIVGRKRRDRDDDDRDDRRRGRDTLNRRRDRDDDDRRERDDRRGPRFDLRSVRVPGAGRSAGPYGREILPARMRSAVEDVLERFAGRGRRRLPPR